MTALEVIKRSLRLLTVVDADEELTATQASTAVLALNAMMAEWEASGLDLGYTPIVTTAATLTVPDDALEAIAYNLGGRLAPEYGVTPSLDFLKFAGAGYQSLLRESLRTTTTTTVQSLLLRALRLAGLPYKSTSYYLSDALLTLNQMLARWEADGLSIGWMPVTSVSDTLVMPEDAKEAVAYNLAVKIAPEYGYEPSALVFKTATDSYNAIYRDAMGRIVSQNVGPVTEWRGWNISTGQ